MMFFLRAAFWLAVVSVFVPQDFAGNAFDLPFDTAETRIDADGAVSAWCMNHASLCDAGDEAVQLGGFLAGFAATQIQTALEERQAANS